MGRRATPSSRETEFSRSNWSHEAGGGNRALMAGFNTSKANRGTMQLNAIVAEGWELINASFVFVFQGEQSRDKFMSSGPER